MNPRLKKVFLLLLAGRFTPVLALVGSVPVAVEPPHSPALW